MITIKSAAAENFAGFDTINVSFDKNITYIVGLNGTGKSIAGVRLIQYIFQGIAEKPSSSSSHPIIGERFRFFKKGEPSKGHIIIHDSDKDCDIIIKRKLTKDGTELSFEAPEGIVLDQKWLNDIFNIYMINPKAFIDLSSKEQAVAIGVDISDINNKIKERKEERKVINRLIKAEGELSDQPEKIEEQDITLLTKELQQASENNVKVTHYDRTKKEYTQKITDLKEKINELTECIDHYTKEINTINTIKYELIDIDKINEQIKISTENNEKALVYKNWINKRNTIKELNNKFQAENEEIIKLENQKLEKIKEKKFPFANLSIDEEGQLLLDNKPIKESYFSAGELERIIPLIQVTSFPNQKLRYVYLENATLMDKNKLASTIKFLNDNNFQVVAEIVGEEYKTDSHVIIMKDQISTSIEINEENNSQTELLSDI